MGKCYFVSDLHLLANRSTAHRHLEQLARTAAHAEVFVLGGDIFDFRWAGMPIVRSVGRAVQWLLELTSSCPQCHFHLVLGNHDYHQVFIDRLVRLEKQVHNLSWHRYYVRLGHSVFLHGDVASRPRMDARRLAEARDQWLDKRRRGPFLSRLYDVVVLDAAAQAGGPPGLLEADRGPADTEVLGEHRARPRRRRPRRLLRPHPPAALQLPLSRPGVSQRRRADQRHEVPHRRGAAVRSGLGA